MALGWNSVAEGITNLEGFFDYAGYKARDLREPLHRSKEHIQYVMQLQFDTEGEARSGGWAPLTEDYLAWKEMHSFPGETILRLTTEMERIVMSDSSWTVTMQQADFHPPSEKAGWHQEGAVRSRGGVLPPRPILDLADSDYGEIENFFYEWLDELRDANARRGGVPSAFPAIFT